MRPADSRNTAPTVYAENEGEAGWLAAVDPLLADAAPQLLGDDVPDTVASLAEYARPDAVVVADGEPQLVIEQTSHVPTGHNIGQRFDRVVRAAERNVPFLLFAPFVKRKGGDDPGNCYLHRRYFEALHAIEEIHETPMLAACWPANDDGTLVADGSETRLIARLVRDLAATGYDVAASEAARQIKAEMAWGYDLFERCGRDDGLLPPRVTAVDTGVLVADWRERYGEMVGLPDDFLDRRETLVYEVGMTPANCDREDPYVGNQFVYDYLKCRTGPSTGDRTRNFVFDVPAVSVDTWVEANPNDADLKSRMWYEVADAIALEDGVVHEYGTQSDTFREASHLDDYAVGESIAD